MKAQVDDDGDFEEALQPKCTYNPVLQRVYQNLEIRALDEQAEIQPLDPVIAKYVNPNKELFDNAADELKDFSEQFTFKVREKKKGKKRKHWEDVGDILDNLFAEASQMNSGAGNSEKKEDDVNFDDLDFDDIGAEKITKIGTQNPIKDFEAILKTRSSTDLFGKLHDEMWKVITSLISTSFQDSNYQKVEDCINHLRKKSIVEEEPKEFNQKLVAFKSTYEVKIPDR
eukprot:UN31846